MSDGGCLRSALENVVSKYVDKELCRFELTLTALNYTKVFVYDAIPVRETDEKEDVYNLRIKRQQNMLDAAARVHGVHVYEGDARRRNKRLEQKHVDVMIAVDMLTHTFRKNMDRATLLTGDSDFKPLIDALVREGMFVTLWHPERTNSELLRAADARRPIAIDELFNFLEPTVKSSISLPSVNVTIGGATPHAPTVSTIHKWTEDGNAFELIFDGTQYVLTCHQGNRKLQVLHPDPGMLRMYSKDRFSINIPPFEPHPSWVRS
jgi:uncharacterized LabA/DUF88 family protein